METRPLRLFYSYSHRDEAARDALAKHLAVFRRSGAIEEWHDRAIPAGAEWAGDIDRNLERADVVVLLVSADFIASDYCYGIELRRALERHEAGEACVVPVIARTVSWRAAPFGKLQALPTDGKPVDSWDNPDEAWTNVAEGIGALIEATQRRVAAAEAAEDDLPTKLRVLEAAGEALVLVVEEGLAPGRSYEIDRGAKLVIGRGSIADLQLAEDDRLASRHHAWVESRREGLVVHDFNSKNGTYVNGKRVESQRLRRGDRVRCGRTILRVDTPLDPDRTQTVMVPRTSRTGAA